MLQILMSVHSNVFITGAIVDSIPKVTQTRIDIINVHFQWFSRCCQDERILQKIFINVHLNGDLLLCANCKSCYSICFFFPLNCPCSLSILSISFLFFIRSTLWSNCARLLSIWFVDQLRNSFHLEINCHVKRC